MTSQSPAYAIPTPEEAKSLIQYEIDDVRREHVMPFNANAGGSPAERGFLVGATLEAGEFEYRATRLAKGHDERLGQGWPNWTEIEALQDEAEAEIIAAYAAYFHNVAEMKRFTRDGGAFEQDGETYEVVLPSGVRSTHVGCTPFQAFVSWAPYSGGEYRLA